MPPIEPKLTDDQIIPTVEDVFDRWVLGGIQAVGKSGGPALAFVLIACAIDYLTGFWKGRPSNEKDYIEFLEAHPEFAAKYVPKDIYGSLRCGLVHNFTIHGGAYALTSSTPQNHLRKAQSGHIFLNLEDFFADFVKLKEAVFSKAKTDADARTRFLARHRSTGFLINVVHQM